MDTRITPKSTQHTGMSLSTEGSVAAWESDVSSRRGRVLHAAISTFTLRAAVACNSRRRDSTVLQTESEEGSAIAFRSTCEFASWHARYDTTRPPLQSLRRPRGRVRAPPTPDRLENEFSRPFDGISSWDNECTLRSRRPDMWLGLGESG